ncbi:MAG TPA: RidA family protein [Candidatus Limnocylindrales bacterium]|jgi:enamine deaminase RidA (YjgF/YER057c/UK114 family)|nr:RidA family protein [Candidatus Limnocylindrales bacterium]
MPVSHSGDRRREKFGSIQRGDSPLAGRRSPLVSSAAAAHPVKAAGFSVVDLGKSSRVSLMLTPEARGAFEDQARETLSTMAALLDKTPKMQVTSQTVFLKDLSTQAQCEQILTEHYGSNRPLTNFVFQPPCSGAALALEAWAIGGSEVQIERFGPHVLAVSYDGVRWVHCSGICVGESSGGAYEQTISALEQMQAALIKGGSDFRHVVRTWFCLGDITATENGKQRYMELNRARTDFYNEIRFCCSLPVPTIPHGIYPASTGIGMAGKGLNASCISLQTTRKDAFLLPLENPLQTPAYAYPPKYSEKSPKFSRAKAFVQGRYVTTWISGTASVVHSESRFFGDVAQQTIQTIDNMQRLIAPENFAFHGIKGAGATLQDVAKIRVYLRHAKDLAVCKPICEERFGSVPAIYAVADICRPELLVEIEGVAFSRYEPIDI